MSFAAKSSRAVALVSILVACAAPASAQSEEDTGPVRVGILHSKQGTMASSELPVIDATQLAIDEVNAAGGVLGRKIQAIVADGRSDPETFAREAQRLITQDNVCTIFGCWTSAARRTIKPIIERRDSLLVYPVQYEGMEDSPNIVYTGAAPNQQVIPAVKWSFDTFGKRFFLVGSDYIFPRMANAIIHDQARALRAEIVGEEYLPLGETNVASLIQKIKAAQPAVILNTINGDSNVAFFKALRAAGVESRTTPTISFSISESEVAEITPALLTGDYAAWNYFQSIDTPENKAFVTAFQKKFGADRVTNDPMEAAYFGVHIWAEAIKQAGVADAPAIRRAFGRQSYSAPGGLVYIDPATMHTWKTVRIGRIMPNGQFDVAWTSEEPIRPRPYPIYRPRAEWDQIVQKCYEGWGKSWVAPRKPDAALAAASPRQFESVAVAGPPLVGTR